MTAIVIEFHLLGASSRWERTHTISLWPFLLHGSPEALAPLWPFLLYHSSQGTVEIVFAISVYVFPVRHSAALTSIRSVLFFNIGLNLKKEDEAINARQSHPVFQSHATMLLESQQFSSPPGVDFNSSTHSIGLSCPLFYQHLPHTELDSDGVADRTRRSTPQMSSISTPVSPDLNHSNDYDPGAPSSSRIPYHYNTLYRLRRSKSF